MDTLPSPRRFQIHIAVGIKMYRLVETGLYGRIKLGFHSVDEGMGAESPTPRKRQQLYFGHPVFVSDV